MDGQGNVKERIKIIKGEVKGNSDLKRSDFVQTFVQFCAFVSFNTLLTTVSLDLSFLRTERMQGQSVGLNPTETLFDLCRNQNMLFLVCEQLLRFL